MFLYLEFIYKNKVWVIVDVGKEEVKIIDELRSRYIKNGWNEGNFFLFFEYDFENYYFKWFRVKVKIVLVEIDK